MTSMIENKTVPPFRKSDQGRQRRQEKARQEMRKELDAAVQAMRQRVDYHPIWDYFLDLQKRVLDPAMLVEAVQKPLIEHLCNQAPYELFHAMGLHPYRLGSGCYQATRPAAAGTPVLMCPMLKSAVGLSHVTTSSSGDPLMRVIPTTCDWVVKYSELVPHQERSHFYLELPHLREGEGAQRHWLEALHGLVRFLEQQTGRRLKRKALHHSVRTFLEAWQAFESLIACRRQGRLAGVWFVLVANSFMLDPIEVWTEQVQAVLAEVGNLSKTETKGIFLSGCPTLFPNLKLPLLIESAGMTVLGDDLCTSERVLPGVVACEDTSFRGLMRALAERYHTACSCPTFADNDRRINRIRSVWQQCEFHGVVHQVFKGCHPFDIESFHLERELKKQGIHFLKIETDYVEEDHRNILTRLEAFGQI